MLYDLKQFPGCYVRWAMGQSKNVATYVYVYIYITIATERYIRKANRRHKLLPQQHNTSTYVPIVHVHVQCSPQAKFKAWWEGMVRAGPVVISKLLRFSPFLYISKEILHWRLVGLTCLMYAGENRRISPEIQSRAVLLFIFVKDQRL